MNVHEEVETQWKIQPAKRARLNRSINNLYLSAELEIDIGILR